MKMLSVRAGRRHTGRALHLKVKGIKITSYGFGDCFFFLLFCFYFYLLDEEETEHFHWVWI